MVGVHGVHYSIYPKATKMYWDFQEIYQCSSMKRDIKEFVDKGATYEQVKVENQRPDGKLKEFVIPTWEWEEVNLDIVTGLPHSCYQHNSIYVILDRLTKLVHF